MTTQDLRPDPVEPSTGSSQERPAETGWRRQTELVRGGLTRSAFDETAEAIAFLNWMEDNNFTYMGYRYYSFEGRGRNAVAKIREGSGLGILRDESFQVFHGLRNLGTLPKDVQDFVQQPELLRIN